jgi:hypothetical protein
MTQGGASSAGGCWIDLYEELDFKGMQRRLFGPGSYPSLRGSGMGVRIGSVVTGPSAYVQVFQYHQPELCIWFLPDQRIADLAACGVGQQLDSIRLLLHPPDASDPGYPAFQKASEQAS